MSTIPTIAPFLPTLEHGVVALAELRDDFATFCGAVSLDALGWVLDFTLFVGGDDCSDTALDWAQYYAANDLSVRSSLLLSGEVDYVHLIAESDLEWFGAASRVLRDDGIALLDWLRADELTVRSMAVTCGTASQDWLS